MHHVVYGPGEAGQGRPSHRRDGRRAPERARRRIAHGRACIQRAAVQSPRADSLGAVEGRISAGRGSPRLRSFEAASTRRRGPPPRRPGRRPTPATPRGRQRRFTDRRFADTVRSPSNCWRKRVDVEARRPPAMTAMTPAWIDGDHQIGVVGTAPAMFSDTRCRGRAPPRRPRSPFSISELASTRQAARGGGPRPARPPPGSPRRRSESCPR